LQINQLLMAAAKEITEHKGDGEPLGGGEASCGTGGFFELLQDNIGQSIGFLPAPQIVRGQLLSVLGEAELSGRMWSELIARFQAGLVDLEELHSTIEDHLGSHGMASDEAAKELQQILEQHLPSAAEAQETSGEEAALRGNQEDTDLTRRQPNTAHGPRVYQPVSQNAAEAAYTEKALQRRNGHLPYTEGRSQKSTYGGQGGSAVSAGSSAQTDGWTRLFQQKVFPWSGVAEDQDSSIRHELGTAVAKAKAPELANATAAANDDPWPGLLEEDGSFHHRFLIPKLPAHPTAPGGIPAELPLLDGLERIKLPLLTPDNWWKPDGDAFIGDTETPEKSTAMAAAQKNSTNVLAAAHRDKAESSLQSDGPFSSGPEEASEQKGRRITGSRPTAENGESNQDSAARRLQTPTGTNPTAHAARSAGVQQTHAGSDSQKQAAVDDRTPGPLPAQTQQAQLNEGMVRNAAPETNRSVLPEDITAQIVNRMQMVSNAERGEVRIQLQPDHLGEVRIRVVVEQGVVTAQFAAESPTVKEIIQSQLGQLRSQLQEMGLEVDSVSVDVSGGEARGDGGFSGQGPWSEPDHSSHSGIAGEDEITPVGAEPARPAGIHTDGSVNLRA